MAEMTPATALIVVDMQNDFGHPDGSLFVDGGDTIIDAINDEIERAAAAGGTIVLTQDWHPASTPHFIDDGGVWPTHCVAGSWGAALVDNLDPNHRASTIVRKGTHGEDGYSAFSMPRAGWRRRHPHRTRRPAARAWDRTSCRRRVGDRRVRRRNGHECSRRRVPTAVLWEATRPVSADADTTDRVLAELNNAHVTVIGAPT